MNLGVPPTEEKALTGEFTPPGMRAHASSKSAAEAATDNGVRCMTTSVPARQKASTTGCSGDRSPTAPTRRESALGGQREDRVIGVVRKLAPIALDDLAGLGPVGGDNRPALLHRDLRRDVLLVTDRDIRDCADVFHPLRLAAGRHQVLDTADLRNDHPTSLRL